MAFFVQESLHPVKPGAFEGLNLLAEASGAKARTVPKSPWNGARPLFYLCEQ